MRSRHPIRELGTGLRGEVSPSAGAPTPQWDFTMAAPSFPRHGRYTALAFGSMAADGFLSLLETHDHLDELFSLHQQAVLVMRWPLALELLGAYRRLLTLHVEQEEQVLLPLFKRAGTVERAPVVLFTGQHRKLFAQLDRITAYLESVQQQDDIRRRAIDVLDLETAFKHLVEHHDGAEVAYFYPTLQKMASVGETRELVMRCWQDWNSARNQLVPLVARAQQALDASTK